MVRLVPMAEGEYQRFLGWSIADYAQEQVKSGAWGSEEAMERGEKVFDKLLPDGLSTPNQFLFVIESEGNTPVGNLWYGVREEGERRSAALYELVIFEEYRRRGYASQALSALEGEVQERGMKQIILHVFGHNQGARDLYRKSGYVERNVTMVKEIG
jgi:ribosomal protein S18 acetylase RimI-like enzyme